MGHFIQYGLSYLVLPCNTQSCNIAQLFLGIFPIAVYVLLILSQLTALSNQIAALHLFALGAHGRFVPYSVGSVQREARTQTLEPDVWMSEVKKVGHATRRRIPLTHLSL